MVRLRPPFPGGLTLPTRAPAGDGPARQLPFAPWLSLPLRQGGCAPAVAVVREGDEVVRGQLLARADGEASAALHAPASGTVQAIVEQADPADPAGGTVQALRLVPWPGDTQEQAAGTPLDPALASQVELLEAIAAAGLVTLAGERQPLHARVRAAAAQGVRWLVLNGIAEEPLLGGARATLATQAADLLFGLRCLLKASGATRAVLAVEPGDEEAARAFVAAAGGTLSLSLRVLPPRYPQGEEGLLLRVLADVAASRGSSPPAGASWALCVDVATAAEAGRWLASRQGMTDQVVTLVGGAVRERGRYRVPLGTPLRFALAFAGLDPGVARVLRGGPMRGEALASLDTPIGKGDTGFVALDPAEAGAPAEPMPCIRCGECLAVCPVRLNPAELGLLARKGELQVMHEKYNVEYCFECGCCAYVCPSRIPLVEQFRTARARWRQRRQAVIGEDAA